MPPLDRHVTHLIVATVACVTMSGCGAMIDSLLGNPDSCRDNCDETYQACLEQVGTPDANHYCLSRRNQCVQDC